MVCQVTAESSLPADAQAYATASRLAESERPCLPFMALAVAARLSELMKQEASPPDYRKFP